MTTEFKLPELGEDIETGDIINIMVTVGDSVTKEQSLMEIETDKAVIELPAPIDGSIKELHVKKGDNIKIGQLLVTFDEIHLLVYYTFYLCHLLLLQLSRMHKLDHM